MSVVRFRVDTCQMYLDPEEVLKQMTLEKLRKLLKWAWQDPENDLEIRRLFEPIHDIEEMLFSAVEEAKQQLGREYRSPEFGEDGYPREKEEQPKVRAHNQKLANQVEKARHALQMYKKKIPKLEELMDLYSDRYTYRSKSGKL